jgi:hypothetical protein
VRSSNLPEDLAEEGGSAHLGPAEPLLSTGTFSRENWEFVLD